MCINRQNPIVLTLLRHIEVVVLYSSYQIDRTTSADREGREERIEKKKEEE